VTLLIQRLGIIVRDASSTILRQQAWVTISKRVMQKLPSARYSLFEDSSFQAHYGLVIREASYRSITLVDTLLSTGPILLGLIGLAGTLFFICTLMVKGLLVIAIPAAVIEQRFSTRLKQLTARFPGLRGAAASVQVIGLGLALVAAGHSSTDANSRCRIWLCSSQEPLSCLG